MFRFRHKGVLCVRGGGIVHGLLVVGRTRPLAQPIALAGHRHDGRVRDEAIEDRGRGRDVAEEDAPVLGRSVRGNQRRRGFMPADEDRRDLDRDEASAENR